MKIAALSVNRPVAMSMIIFFLLIVGMVSFTRLDVDLFPELEFPVAVVLIDYPGAAPEEIETLLTIPLENAVGTVSNVEEVRSTSRLGGTLVLVEFDWGTDMDAAMLEIRERLDRIRTLLPEGSSQPSVIKFDPQSLPVMQLAVSSTEHNIAETKRITENIIQPHLQTIEGIASIEIEGGRESEILLRFDRQQLQAYDLNLISIQQMLRTENVNVPGGLVLDQEYERPLRITGQFRSLQDIEDFPIPTRSGLILPLSSFAQIEERLKTTSVLSMLNGQPGVGIVIQKRSGANTLAVGERIHRTLDEIRQELPAGMTISPIFDQSLYIKQTIQTLGLSILAGAILAILVLFAFLRHIKSTLIVALSIPVSLIATITFIYLANLSINMLTLGGLALAVGMMVDNAIVILENIYRYRQNGHSMKSATIDGTSEIGQAVIASTATTIIVFLPMLFVDGLAAQLFQPLGLVVTLALLASLFTSLIIVPLFASRMIHIPQQIKHTKVKVSKWLHMYKDVLSWSIQRPGKVSLVIIAVVICTLLLIPFVGTEFLPHLDESVLYMNFSLPIGTPAETTMERALEVEERIQEIPEIQSIYLSVGGFSQFQVGAGTVAHRANFTIPLVPSGSRSRSDHEIANDIRQQVDDLAGIRVNINAGERTGLGGSPISIQIRGNDALVLESLSHEVMDVLGQVQGVTGINSDFTRGQQEIHYSIDRFKAAQYGVSTAQISRAIQEFNQGLLATRLSRAGEEIDVRLALNQEDDHQLEFIQQIELSTSSGSTVTLDQVGSFTEDSSPHTIRRTDRVRQVTVNAQISERDLGSVMNDIRQSVNENIMQPSGYVIHYGGQDEEMDEAFNQLFLALALAIVLVYMVMAIQFESYFQPLIIMFAVPLAWAGVLIGLFVTGYPLGVGALIGVLILTGIVVNNSIVLIDYVNTLRKEGMSRDEALLKAAPIRLRPILMTAITTMLGLFPLMLGFGEGSEIQAPMATVVVFGLFFATLVSLIFIPIMYKWIDEWREKYALRKQQKSS